MEAEEIINQAQDRLLEKRKTLGMETGNPTPLIVSLPDRDVYTPPKCREHGITLGECELCNEANERRYREYEEEEARKIAKTKERIAKERNEHPEKWLEKYNVPRKFMGCSFDNFRGGEQVKEICRTFPSKSILLSGKTGCGKTHLAVATLRDMVRRDAIQYTAIFTTTPELLLDIRSCYSSNGDEKDLVEKYSTPAILILDDLGADKATEWAISTLYLIIDRRNKDMKETLITTNLTMEGIENQYGARIASRLSDMVIVEIKMPDYRKKRA